MHGRQVVAMPYESQQLDEGEQRLAALWEQPPKDSIDAERGNEAADTLFTTRSAVNHSAPSPRRARRDRRGSVGGRWRPWDRRSPMRLRRPRSRHALVLAVALGAAVPLLSVAVGALTGSGETRSTSPPAIRISRPATRHHAAGEVVERRQSRAAPVHRRRATRPRSPADRRTRSARPRPERHTHETRRDADAPPRAPAPRAPERSLPVPVPASSACDEFPPC